MKLVQNILISLAFVILLTSAAGAFVITMDDIPPTISIRYYDRMGCCFVGRFEVAAYSEGAWWRPHSGTNVARCDQNRPAKSARIVFKTKEPLNVQLVGAYFSTQKGVIVQMQAYDNNRQLIASTVIGSAGESWDNRYAEVTAGDGSISYVDIVPMSADDALCHFCFDDLKVEPKSDT